MAVVELFVMGDARGVEEKDDDVPVTPPAAAPRVGEVNVEEEVVATVFFMGDNVFG